MRRSIWERIQEIINKHVIHGKWVRSVIALSCVVIFITTYVLVMPAVTLSGTPDCGQEEHRHTDDCYETQSEQICGLEEHTHSDDCYDEDGNLICGLEEHAHNDGCYETEEVLTCGMEEHIHTSDCYNGADAEEADSEDSSSSAGDAGEAESKTEQGEDVTDEVNSEDAETVASPEATEAADPEGPAESEEPASGDLLVEGEDYTITVSYTEEANLPADVSLKVEEITNKEEYEGYKSQVEEEILDPESKKVTAARFFDITLLDSEGNELHPEKAVTVVIETKDTLKENEELQVCHFDQEQEKPVIVKSQEIINETYEEDNLGVQFEAETFYVYGIVRTKPIGTTVLTADGETYTVTVSYTEEANLPADVSLKVEEITNKEEYEGYKSQVEEEILDPESKKVTAARFFDITLLDSEGNELHPEKAVTVVIETKDTLKENEELQVCHFDQEQEKPVIVKSQEIINETYEEDNLGIQFEAESFSVYGIVGTETITVEHIDHKGTKYEVTVTYGANANIPEGSTLSVTDIEEDSAEYDYARNSVLADKKEKGESVDIEEFNLAALDISIIGPDGKEVEPEEAVQVNIKIKELPGVEILDRVKDTIEIQHHVDTEDGVVIEKVYEGKTEGTYTMDTNENVIASGTVVDPNSVSEEDFQIDEDVSAEMESGVNEEEIEESVTINFGTASFSTYTITWAGAGRGTNNSTATMRFRSGKTNYATVNVHFVDQNGTPITRPGNDPFNASPNPDNNEITTYNLEQTTIFGNITGWSYVGTYRDEARTQPITEIQVGRGTAVPGNNIRSIAFFNGEEQIGNTVAVANGAADGGDIYVVYSNSESHMTVHFVNRNGEELTDIKDPNGNIIDGGTIEVSASNNPIDLSTYTKDGYTYANTRINGYGDAGTIVYPNVRWLDNRAAVTLDSTNNADSTSNNNVRYLIDGDNIYVILDPVPSGSGGGGGGDDPTPISDLPDPETSKTLTDNKDGTYDLNLSITGKSDSKQENKNINVLFIIDNSSSMTEGAGTGNSRLYETKAAVIAAAETLFKNNTTAHPDLVELAAITFDRDENDAVSWTNDKTTFDNAINSISAGSGTNWEDGLLGALNYGTGDGDPTYVIFFTDGMPYGYRGANNTYKSSSNLPAMMAAKDEARAIVNSGRPLYNIFAYGSSSDYNADYLGQLTDYAYNDSSQRSTYYKSAASSDDVVRALSEIVDSITQAAGFTNVELTDGITDLTHSVLVNGQAGGFTYYRSGGKDEDGNEKYDSTANEGRGEIWTTADGAPPASYSSSTGVTWDLGDLLLEDGVTYTVSFTVWPDQDAYDTVADINNSANPRAAYDALDQDVKDQIIFDETTGKCSLKTNTEAKANYTSIKTSTETKLPEGATSTGTDTWTYTDKDGKVWTYVKNEDGTYTGTTTQDKELTYEDVPAMSLDKTTMKVKKIWEDTLTSAEDRPASVQFTVYEDGTAYQVVNLTGSKTDSVWEKEITIAPGIYVTPGTHDTASSGNNAGVMEGAEGHVYTIAETGYSVDGETITEGVENHYDFETTPVKPMLNGTTTTDKTDMIEYLTMTTWSASEAALVATNTVKDGIYIYKKVTTDGTDEIDCDEQFTFKVTLKDVDGNPVYLSGQGKSGDLAWRIDEEDASSPYGYTEKERGYYTSTDGTVTLTMDASGRIRIVNVPVGTTFTVEEVTDSNPSGYEYYNTQVNTDNPTTDNKATDTTVGNKQWAVTVTNKRNALNVDLLKVDNAQLTKTLEGAEFTLLKADGTTPATDADGNAIGTITSGSDGKATIGNLLAGIYVLQETKAPAGYDLMSSNVTITVTADNVTAMQGTSQCNVEKSADGLTYTIRVTNSAGVELPMTGGSGTLPYTLGGLMLIIASALMYGFRMRRRERRLN